VPGQQSPELGEGRDTFVSNTSQRTPYLVRKFSSSARFGVRKIASLALSNGWSQNERWPGCGRMDVAQPSTRTGARRTRTARSCGVARLGAYTGCSAISGQPVGALEWFRMYRAAPHRQPVSAVSYGYSPLVRPGDAHLLAKGGYHGGGHRSRARAEYQQNS